MRWFIAGPMTGLPENNFPLFRKAALVVEAEPEHTAVHLVDEAERAGGAAKKTTGQWVTQGLKMLLDCDGLVLLPNWNFSDNATLEARVAVATDMPIRFFDGERLHVRTDSVREYLKPRRRDELLPSLPSQKWLEPGQPDSHHP